MLSKLLKYEIKATSRILLPLYVVLLVYSVVHMMISSLTLDKWNAPQIISFIVYIMIFIGIFVMTLILIIQRFYKNLLTDEGYLMFTLPTRPWNHIVCKLLVSMMWSVVSSIVGIISIVTIFSKEIFTESSMKIAAEFFGRFFERFNISTAVFILEALLVIIVGLVSNVLIVYASIALGHLFARHKILASLGAFIVLSTASQILFTIIGSIGSRFPVESIGVEEIFNLPPMLHLALWFVIIFFGLLSAGYFLVTNYMLSRRLNLE